jgi:alpha-glucosidase
MNYLQKLGLDAIWIAPMYWARVAPNGKAVLVAMNFSNRPKSIVVDLARAAINGKTADTLATSTPSLQGRISLHEITLPPYTSWLGSVH